MTITAKFPGTCRKCGGGVQQGEQVEWERGKGVAHPTCPAVPAPAPAKKQAPDLPGPELVPAGRYAVDWHGELALVKVWRGSRNPSFVKVYDDDTANEWRFKDTAALLELLKDDSFAYAQAYGKLRCRCSRCGLKLKDQLSVKLAIGPTCIKHWHDAVKVTAMKAEARAELRAEGIDPNEKLDEDQLSMPELTVGQANDEIRAMVRGQEAS